MNRFKKCIFSVISILVVAFLAACSNADTPISDNQQLPDNQQVADVQQSTGNGPFENLSTVDIYGNAVTAQSIASNKLTIINVWNLGCTPCIQEIPALEKLNNDYSSKGVAVMGLYYNFGEKLPDDERAEITELLNNANATYTHILASENMMKFDELKELMAFPTTFFVDGEGNILETVQGSNTYDDWAALTDEMLKKVS